MGSFNIEDAASVNKEKMIRRHPHVFGNNKVSRRKIESVSQGEMNELWEEAKKITFQKV